MTLKENKTAFNDLLERFEIFSDMETIDELNNKFLPKINLLYNNIEDNNEKNRELNECIIKFDQNLSLKANKSLLV